MDALTDPMIASQFGRLERRIAELEAELEATVTECMAAKSNEDILKAENQRLLELVSEAGEAFEAASEGGGVNFHAYALYMKAALQEGE